MDNKVIAITGGGGILGRAVAALLAARGARIAVADRANPDHVHGAELILGNIDLTEARMAESAMKTIHEKLGGLDAVIHVAGAFRWQTLAEGNTEVWDFLYAVNLKSAVVTAKAALPYLLKVQGNIVNIGANAAHKGTAGMGAYTAAKAGIARFTEALADELKDQGVRVNAVLPSIIDTPQNRVDMPNAEHARWVRPDAIAEVIAFLLSPAASAITGACIPVIGRV
jgi:NAD(P)-dependent dehydrogenase (short-subunit alcohol dehydrogenase family)